MKQKKTRIWLTGGACLLLVAAVFFLLIQKSAEEGKLGVENMTLSLRTQTGKGNGVIWEASQEKMILLTAAHVAGDLKPGDSFDIEGDRTVVAEEVSVSSVFDMVFVQVDSRELRHNYASVRIDEEAFDYLTSGDNIYAVGSLDGISYVREGKVKGNWIYMEDFGYHMIWGQMPEVESGMSGSGIFDEEGRFCGILCGGSEGDEIAVLPLSIIQTEWKNVDILRK